MNSLCKAIKDYHGAIDEYYSDGFYPGVQEQKEIDDLQYEVLKEADNAAKDLDAILLLLVNHYGCDRYNAQKCLDKIYEVITGEPPKR